MTYNVARLRFALRSLAILCSFQIAAEFIRPALWVLYEPSSVVSKVASLAYSPTALAVVWFLCGAAVVPFMVMQMHWPDCKYRRLIIKTANFGMIGGGLLWFFLAFLSRNLDYQFATWNFIFNAVTSMTMAYMLASNLNSDQKEQAGP